ncbi:SDR family oxidoreductase [Nakamurella lactea]|uniref:SDR family oxidoreductase n=1 Tax=Nakamurella lactea TaxID=459515 RepID=UPI0004102709|nr:SDR family oxidoreductase [Nakamurella lactea]
MDQTHAGKVAIVTGGSRGIGRAIAKELVARGATVIIVGRRQAPLESAAAAIGARCEWRSCHVADTEGAAKVVAETVQRHGTVDLLVNNAAAGLQWGPTLAVDPGAAAKMAEVNQWAPVLWSRLAHESVMRARGGAIVNITSIGGLAPSPNTGYYNATKAALSYLTQQLAAELAPRVRVNAVAPGLIDTDMAAAIPAEQAEQLRREIPLARLGQPDDIAAATSFLLSDAAAWITGAVLPVDGGHLHHRGVAGTPL